MNGLTRSSGRKQRATNDHLPIAFSFEGAKGLRPDHEMVPPSSWAGFPIPGVLLRKHPHNVPRAVFPMRFKPRWNWR